MSLGVSVTASYDAFNRIFDISPATNAQQHYRYDALGRRIVAMEISGAADDSNTLITLGRRYIYDGWSVVEERTFDNSATLGDSPNTLERVYVNGRSIDEPLLVAIDGDSDGFLNSSKNTTNGVNIVDAEYYYLSNRLGSISAILDADNQDRILEYYRYEVFGSATVLPIVDNNTDGLEDTPLDLNDNNALGTTLVSSFGNTYLYTARRFDDITGLYYYRNRYYDPRSGRFITRDPAESPQNNLYGYVMNGVSNFIDPFGLEPGIGGESQEPYMDPRVGAVDPRSPFERSSDEAAYKRKEARECKDCDDLTASEVAHALLDVAGLIPVAGIVFDAANAVVYLAEEDYVNAGIAAGAMIPVVGQGCTAAKFVKLGVKSADEIRAATKGAAKAAEAAKEAVESATKGATKGSVEGATKEVAKTSIEGAAKKVKKLSKAESKTWKGFKSFRGKTKTNGLTGKKKRYFEWDHTHGEIEVYDKTGKHLGTMDPETGKMIKPAVPGREIDV